MTDKPLRLRLARAHITFDLLIDDGDALRPIGDVIKDGNGNPGMITADVDGAEWATYTTGRFVTDLAALEEQINAEAVVPHSGRVTEPR